MESQQAIDIDPRVLVGIIPPISYIILLVLSDRAIHHGGVHIHGQL